MPCSGREHLKTAHCTEEFNKCQRTRSGKEGGNCRNENVPAVRSVTRASLDAVGTTMASQRLPPSAADVSESSGVVLRPTCSTVRAHATTLCQNREPRHAADIEFGLDIMHCGPAGTSGARKQKSSPSLRKPQLTVLSNAARGLAVVGVWWVVTITITP